MGLKIVRVNDYSNDAIREMEKAVAVGLIEVGMKAEGYAKLKAPVDTGRLRNSINWATDEKQGNGGDKPKGTPSEQTVCIGTNVEYAKYQELGDYKHKVGYSPFLRPAIEENIDEYKRVLQDALEGRLS